MRAARSFAIEKPTRQERQGNPGVELVLRLQVGGAVYTLPISGTAVAFFAEVDREAREYDEQLHKLTQEQPLIALAPAHALPPRSH